MVKHTYLY